MYTYADVYPPARCALCCVCTAPPNNMLLQAVRVVDYDEQVLVAGFKSWFGGILCLDWSPDGRYIVTGGEVRARTPHARVCPTR